MLPASFLSPGLPSMLPGQARDKDPGLSVCPTRQPGPAAAPWAKLGWKHSASLGCQLPVPSRGMRCWRPHDSSAGQRARPRAGPPPCSAPAGCQEAHVTPPGQALPGAPAGGCGQTAPGPALLGAALPQSPACGMSQQGPTPDGTGHRRPWAAVGLRRFRSRWAAPPPPQSGCSCQDRRLELQVRAGPLPPPPVSVCERGSRPTSGILHSLLVPSPTCPPGAWGQPPSLARSPSLAPLRLQCRQCSLSSLHAAPACLRATWPSCVSASPAPLSVQSLSECTAGGGSRSPRAHLLQLNPQKGPAGRILVVSKEEKARSCPTGQSQLRGPQQGTGQKQSPMAVAGWTRWVLRAASQTSLRLRQLC